MKNLLSALAILLFFTACSQSEDPAPSSPLPVVSTTAAASITQTTAVSGGAVITAGNSAVTARGVCWSPSNTSPTVGIVGTYTVDGSGLGSFTSNITGLTANTTYYYRAYATNSSGTNYGGTASFTTAP